MYDSGEKLNDGLKYTFVSVSKKKKKNHLVNAGIVGYFSDAPCINDYFICPALAVYEVCSVKKKTVKFLQTSFHSIIILNVLLRRLLFK